MIFIESVTLNDIRKKSIELINGGHLKQLHSAFDICGIDKINELSETDYPLFYAMIMRADQRGKEA